MTAGQVLPVVVDAPQHAGLALTLDYLSEQPLAPGTLVRVPLGRRSVTGIVWHERLGAAADAALLRPVQAAATALLPLSAPWRALVGFCAAYYQRSIGEVALSVLPPELRKLDETQLARRLERLRRSVAVPAAAVPVGTGDEPMLTVEQAAALDALASVQPDDVRPTLLQGVTGSGKTEVYLRSAARALAAGRQVLVLVPEINLTPQLEARFAERFAGHKLVSLHSALTPAQRLRHWLLGHTGQADLVLGTRLAVFASLPRLGLIVVDEEHDPSFKQQEGARYSARDLAVYRGRLEGIPVLLGSATPSLESWHRAETGRYRHLHLSQRIGGGVLPKVRLLDMNALPRQGASAPPALAPALQQAIEQRIARGEQSLLFLNRRGYAPVLFCGACGWKSGCPHCSAWRVFHKLDRTLRCHHCGFTERVPRACPDCGNLDIAPIGRGTEKLEEQIGQLLPGARVARIDADSTRSKGALQAQLTSVHAGEVDVLVGTQMIAKGHDFRGVTLVAAVNPDSALFASDFRAAERLFALLMQAAGRAGRDATAGRAQRDVGPDLAPAPCAVRGAARDTTSTPLPAGSWTSAAPLACRRFRAWRCCVPKRGRPTPRCPSCSRRPTWRDNRPAAARCASTRRCRRRCRAWRMSSACRCSSNRSRARLCSTCSRCGCRNCRHCAWHTRRCCAGRSMWIRWAYDRARGFASMCLPGGQAALVGSASPRRRARRGTRAR